MAKDSKLKGTQLEDFTAYGKKAKVTELEVIDTVTGTGEAVKPDDTVTVHYTGALCATGEIFESSYDYAGNPATFGLNQVIEGWTKGLVGMQVGGKRRLIIPSEMAYGHRRASASIPPNSDLVFDVDLIALLPN